MQSQNATGHTSPNVAILAKLREEMSLLSERKQCTLGKLSLANPFSLTNTTPPINSGTTNENSAQNSTANHETVVNLSTAKKDKFHKMRKSVQHRQNRISL